MLNQIIEEAEEYKLEFYRKSIVTRENNKASNREREKASGDFKILLVFVACFSFLNKSHCGCMHVMFVIIQVCFELTLITATRTRKLVSEHSFYRRVSLPSYGSNYTT